MTAKILSVRFVSKVPSPTTNERIRRERESLDLDDAGPGGFTAGTYGVSYAIGERRLMIPWQQVRWCEMEPAPAKASRKG